MTSKCAGPRIASTSSAAAIIRFLKSRKSPENVAGMAKYGIKPDANLGVCMPVLTDIARKVKGNHKLALELWDSGIRDARILACLVDDPDRVTPEQMDDWVEDFDSWDVCDGCCIHLFSRTRYGHEKALTWSKRREEYVRRAGFAMMASLTVHDKEALDEQFRKFLPLIEKGATDERNYVKKAVNWALRQVGKKNLLLNKEAITVSKRIHKLESKSAKWIASDALRELTSDKVQTRLRKAAKEQGH